MELTDDLIEKQLKNKGRNDFMKIIDKNVDNVINERFNRDDYKSNIANI